MPRTRLDNILSTAIREGKITTQEGIVLHACVEVVKELLEGDGLLGFQEKYGTFATDGLADITRPEARQPT
jgi:hypothetical protein